jgi:hypothetical protein
MSTSFFSGAARENMRRKRGIRRFGLAGSRNSLDSRAFDMRDQALDLVVAGEPPAPEIAGGAPGSSAASRSS